MGYDRTISSSEISKLPHIPYFGEPNTESLLSSSRELYVGRASYTAAPLFLELDAAINPHMFVFGMSGSGKSYLLKSIFTRIAMFTSCRVILIDFTGEYSEFSDAAGALKSTASSMRKILRSKERLIYIGLSGLDESEKAADGVRILESLAERMRELGVVGSADTFVILDEAWKLLMKSKVLEMMIRESRKYGVGIILASQIIGDIDQRFLSNIATLFVFRTHDFEGLSKLGSAYGMADDQLSQIKELDVGGCMFLQLRKGSKSSCFLIDRVEGVRRYREVALKCGVGMEIRFGEEEIVEMARHAQVGEEATRLLLARMKENGVSLLANLLGDMIKMNADRSRLLEALRKMRIPDEQIADAFSAATAGMV